MNVIISISVTMLQALLFSLLTTSSAFTTHRYDSYDSFGNYRPSAPLLDNIFGYENSNGRRPVQVYEYPKQYDGLVNSDMYQIAVAGENRRIDTPYSYQNPYQWNREVPWNRVAVTEPAKFINRFENSNQDRKYVNNSDTPKGQPVVQRTQIQDKEKGTDQRKHTNELNKIQENVSVPHISTQSNDVNHTLVITEKQITWNNEHHDLSDDNANINTRSINSDDKTNSLNVPDKQNEDKTNNRDAYYTANSRNRSTTKTTQDNEVTPRPLEPRTKPYEDDRWVWSNGEDQKVETTTLFDLGDRAAFSGNGCPAGTAKLGNTCVVKD